MSNDSVEETVPFRVEQIIRRQTGSAIELVPETDLLDDLEIDSLELVELGLILEKEFGKKLEMSEVRRCLTLGELTQLIQLTMSKEQVENV